MQTKKLYSVVTTDTLCYHGIKGMHWGIRRYQNPDGTLTEEGKRRYHQSLDKEIGGDVGKSKSRAKEALRTGGVIAGAIAGAALTKIALATLGPMVGISVATNTAPIAAGVVAVSYAMRKYGNTDMRDLSKK